VSKPTLKVTLIRSLHGRFKDHRACATGLGLRKINQVVDVEDSPYTRGMIKKIHYMVKVEGQVK